MKALLLFPILIGIVFFVILFIFLSRKIGSKFWTVKRNKMIVTSYIVLGIVSIVVLLLTTEVKEKVSKEQLESIIAEQNELTENLYVNQKLEINDKYLEDELSFKVTDDLTVKPASDNVFGVSLVFETRDDIGSNEVFAKVYRMPYIINGYDLTKFVPLDRFDYKDDVLTIQEVPELNFDFYKVIPKVQMLDQFISQHSDQLDIYNHIAGTTIVYLNVPKHVNIIDESGYSFWLN